MENRYSWPWVESQAAQAAGVWAGCGGPDLPPMQNFTQREQRKSEKAYDEGLHRVEREARRTPRTAVECRIERDRIVNVFPPFAAVALGLAPEAIELLTGTFLRVGAGLARWARNFDPAITVPDTIQACRNAWTACGLQGLLGQPMQLTPSLTAYSILYPLSDNYLDQPSRSTSERLYFSERFRQRLGGRLLAARDGHEWAVWQMVQLVEQQYPRARYPHVFDCLLAIHRSQEESIAQLERDTPLRGHIRHEELLRISCAKGGTSVLADACLAKPWLSAEESRFAFEWGVLLQFGDDLQDVKEDLERGSATLFTRAATAGQPLDSLVAQLLHFSLHVGGCMDRLPQGSTRLKDLLRMSWRSLILMAVADSQQFFTKEFLAGLERSSAFRFNFLRERNRDLAAREALYSRLFDAFIAGDPADQDELALPAITMPGRSPQQCSVLRIEPALASHASREAWTLPAT